MSQVRLSKHLPPLRFILSDLPFIFIGSKAKGMDGSKCQRMFNV